MASTSTIKLCNSTIGAYTFGLEGYINYDSVSRSDNKVSFNGVNGVYTITGNGSTFSGVDVYGKYEFPNDTTRGSADAGSGTHHKGDTFYTSEKNFSVNVSASATTISVQNYGKVGNDSGWGPVQTLPIPSLGSPSGTDTVQTVTSDTSLTTKVNVTNWGSHASSGSVRSYIADNSSYSGQTYKSTTDNASVSHTGLTPNTKYWLRGWAENGGGKTSWIGSDTGVTLASATETSKDVKAVTVDFSPEVTQGVYATTTKVQYKKTGDTEWTDSPTGAGETPTITASGLLPSTDYDYRYVVTTTAGTWTGDTLSLTTLPAVKLITSDYVHDAVPYRIDGSGKRVIKVNIIKDES